MSDLRQKTDGREILTQGESLSFPVESGMDVCTITELKGICGTAICYHAVRSSAAGKVSGTLTEFYPADPVAGGDPPFYSMERLPDGRLVPCGGTVRRYPMLVRTFAEDYQKLCNLSQKDKTGVLCQIAEKGEILHAVPEASVPDDSLTMRTRIPAVYFWLPDASQMTLEDYLEQSIRNCSDDTSSTADEKLRCVLHLMLQAAESIRTLHKAGFLHHTMDTFFVVQDEEKVPSLRMGTPYGLRTIDSTLPCGIPHLPCDAPELRYGIADIRTDLYAFGVLLFRSIVVHSKIKNGTYDNSLYESIPQLLAASELISKSSCQQNQKLLSMLTKLLHKTLAAEPEKRYLNSDKLIRDLKKAVQFLETAGEQGASASRGSVPKLHADAQLLMKQALYEHPIFRVLTEKGSIRLAAVGTSDYIFAFLDTALQVCQMDGYPLYLTVFCDNPEEARNLYLALRPELPRFAEVFAGMPDHTAIDPDIYGRLCFTAWNAEKEHSAPDSRYINAILQKKRYHYGMVDAGSSAKNRSLAKKMYDAMHHDEMPVSVGYLDYEASDRKEAVDDPVFAAVCNRVLTPQDISPALSRMAFNCDLLWCGNLNMDIENAFRKFLSDPYRFSSSLAYAVSIRYKLFSLDIDAESNAENAKLFHDRILAEKGDAYSRLVMFEHRRWVMEKVTDGWRAPRKPDGSLDLELCVRNSAVKDGLRKLHPCIVKSTEKMPLMEDPYRIGPCSGWDRDEQSLSDLDELDRMSVMLHRLFRKRAEQIRTENSLNEGDVNKLKGMTAVMHEDIRLAWQQYLFCLKNILSGAKGYSQRHALFRRKLERAAEQLPTKQKDEVLSCIRGIANQFFPVIEANLYRDYKKNDQVLVDGIPFILTYHYHPMIVMPFQDARFQGGSNDAAFQNIASASVLSPSHLHYLCCFTKETNPKLFYEKLCGVLSYLQNREVRTEVTMAIARIGEADTRGLETKLKALKETHSLFRDGTEMQDFHARFIGCEVETAANEEEAFDFFKRSIRSKCTILERHDGCIMTDTQQPVLFDGSTPLFHSSAWNSRFIGTIMEEMPYFEFDWRRKIFQSFGRQGAEYLRYIRDNSYISVDDMFALRQAKDKQYQFPEYMDEYEELWSIHTGCYLSMLPSDQFRNGIKNWNRLCTVLSEYHHKHNILAQISTQGVGSVKPDVPMFFYLPAFAFRTAADLLERFKKLKIVSEDSCVSGHTSDTCCVRLQTIAAAKNAMEKLFGKSPQYLQEYYAPYIDRKGDEFVICYVNMEVRDVLLAKKDDHPEEISGMCDLLDALQASHYITGFVRHDTESVKPEENDKCRTNGDEADNSETNPNMRRNQVSFRYTSPRMMKLLTNAGMILELHTFFSVLKSGFFDEVIPCYEFKWNDDSDVINELDLILVRGFTSVFVECKSVNTLDQNYFHKLWSLSYHFGINAMNIIVANLYSNVKSYRNQTQRERAVHMNIQLIHKQKEIQNIADTIIEAYRRHFD